MLTVLRKNVRKDLLLLYLLMNVVQISLSAKMTTVMSYVKKKKCLKMDPLLLCLKMNVVLKNLYVKLTAKQ